MKSAVGLSILILLYIVLEFVLIKAIKRRTKTAAATSILDLLGYFHKENCYDRKNKK